MTPSPSKKLATVALVAPPTVVNAVCDSDRVGPGTLICVLDALAVPIQLSRNGVLVYVHVVVDVPFSGSPVSLHDVPIGLPAQLPLRVVERLPGATLVRLIVYANALVVALQLTLTSRPLTMNPPGACP